MTVFGTITSHDVYIVHLSHIIFKYCICFRCYVTVEIFVHLMYESSFMCHLFTSWQFIITIHHALSSLPSQIGSICILYKCVINLKKIMHKKVETHLPIVFDQPFISTYICTSSCIKFKGLFKAYICTCSWIVKITWLYEQVCIMLVYSSDSTPLCHKYQPEM